MNPGPLEIHASPVAVCVAVIEVLMGFALIAGTILARMRRYRGHAACQAIVVLLNLAIVAGYMAPSFRRVILPGIVRHAGNSYYWLAAVHGCFGLLAELLGIYILLVAGTNKVPMRMRFTCFRIWMRAALVLWWLDLLLGLAVFARWYVRM